MEERSTFKYLEILSICSLNVLFWRQATNIRRDFTIHFSFPLTSPPNPDLYSVKLWVDSILCSEMTFLTKSFIGRVLKRIPITKMGKRERHFLICSKLAGKRKHVKSKGKHLWRWVKMVHSHNTPPKHLYYSQLKPWTKGPLQTGKVKIVSYFRHLRIFICINLWLK